MRTDESFRILVGSLTTLYAVRNRHVQGIDARSYKAAKEKLVTFAATTTPWAVRGTEGDRRWSRGPIHADNAVQGRTDQGTVERLGRQRSGIRCPGCGAENAKAVFRTSRGVACPACAGKASVHPLGRSTGEDRKVQPEALEALTE